MNMIRQRLKLACAEQTLLEVYVSTDYRDRFFAGYVTEYSDESVMLSLVGTSGRSDGYRLQEISRIIHLAWDTQQLRNLAQYARLAQENFPATWNALLERLKADQRLVGLRDQYEEFVYGQVQEFDDSAIVLSSWTLQSGPDGCLVIDRADLTALMFGSEELEQCQLNFGQPT